MSSLLSNLMDVDDISALINDNGELQSQIPNLSGPSRSASLVPISSVTIQEAKSNIDKVEEKNAVILKAIADKLSISDDSLAMVIFLVKINHIVNVSNGNICDELNFQAKKNYFIETSEILKTLIRLTYVTLQQYALVKQYGLEVEEICKNGLELSTATVDALSSDFQTIASGEISTALTVCDILFSLILCNSMFIKLYYIEF